MILFLLWKRPQPGLTERSSKWDPTGDLWRQSQTLCN